MDLSTLCGAIPSPPDKRDYSVKALPELPGEAWVKRMPQIKQQKAGSCVAHSMAYCMEILTGDVFGAGFVYGFRPEGYSQEAGMVPRQAAQTVTNVGDVLLKTYKTEVEMPAMKASVDKHIDKLVRYANKRKAGSYARCYDITDAKSALCKGLPLAFTACISRYEARNDGVFPATRPLYGYHEMTAVGYKGDMFRVANSWSANWGQCGFCWMSAEDVFRAEDVLTVGGDNGEAVFRRTLKVGMKGSDVKALEDRLNREPNIKIVSDGEYSAATEKAVRYMQKKLGLTETGVCDGATWTALGL